MEYKLDYVIKLKNETECSHDCDFMRYGKCKYSRKSLKINKSNNFMRTDECIHSFKFIDSWDYCATIRNKNNICGRCDFRYFDEPAGTVKCLYFNKYVNLDCDYDPVILDECRKRFSAETEWIKSYF